MYKFVALAVVAVCGIGALQLTRSTEIDQPASQTQADTAAQVEAATSIPESPAAPAENAAALSCKDKLTVKLSTSADPKDADRIVVGKWRQQAKKLHGAEFANFKSAEEPVVRCKKQGKQNALSCFAEARPCAK